VFESNGAALRFPRALPLASVRGYSSRVREPLDRAKLDRFLRALGEAARGPGRVYLTGGATALSYGFRARTIDVDLKLDPEPDGAFDAIARLKDELDVNVELASPQDFLPEVPGWRERSVFVARFGPVDVFHYDLVAQVLSKLARGYERDLADAEASIERGLLSRDDVAAAYSAIEPDLVRFPRLDASSFRSRVHRFVAAGGRK
jgi:hypothetical protein